jgi:hypothetical protein
LPITLPVLVLITFPPEYEAPWTGLSHVTSIALDRLACAEVETLAEHVAGRPLPPEVTAQIVAKIDGVPLFVEELTKTVLEGGLLLAGPQGWRLDGPLPPFAIPATLQDSLAARLDRLAPVNLTSGAHGAAGGGNAAAARAAFSRLIRTRNGWLTSAPSMEISLSSMLAVCGASSSLISLMTAAPSALPTAACGPHCDAPRWRNP